MNHGQRICGTLATVLLAATVGGAQVRQVQRSGNALDANYQVGSGGSNAAVSNYNRAHYINSIDRSRGLSAFSGNAPSLSSDLGLGVSAPTNGVSDFRRQSVGIADILRGGSSIVRPQDYVYNDPLRTTTSARRISHTAAITTDMRSRNRSISPLTGMAQDLFVDATSEYRPLMPTAGATPGDAGKTIDLLPGSSAQQEELVRRAEGATLARRGGSELFGVLESEDRASLARQLRDLRREDEQVDPNAAEGAIDATSAKAIESAVTPDVAQRIDARTGLPIPEALPKDEVRQPGIVPGGAEPGAETEIDPRTGLPAQNQDAFFDLVVALRQRGAAEGAPAERSQTDMLLNRREQVEPERQIVETVKQGVVLHALAGKGGDVYNTTMRRAERALRAGRFYQAARQYELATMTRPNAPLARMGSAIARFGAGEWFTAGGDLQMAVDQFPPLMEVHVDLKRLLGEKLAAQRLGQLEGWVETNPRPEMVFLAAWACHNLGLTEKAKDYAGRMRLMENLPMVQRAFADYILTGKRPSETGKDAEKKAPAGETDKTE